MTLTPIPRDVLQMLEVELRLARRGETRLVEIQRGGKPDADYVKMIEDTIAEIKRLKQATRGPMNISDEDKAELIRMTLLAARPAEPGEVSTFTVLPGGKLRLRYDRTLDKEVAMRVFDAIRAADPDWFPETKPA